VAGIAFASLTQPAWAGPRGGGGGFAGGGFAGGARSSGGGRVGGFAGGGSRGAPAFYGGGGLRAAPAFRGAYFTGRSVGTVSRPPSFYYGGSRFTGRSFGGVRAAPRPYYRGTRMSVVRPRGFTAATTSRALSQNAGRVAAANPQSSRVGPIARQNQVSQNRVSDPRTSTAANRQSFIKNHASERHDANNWHRDWDRHHTHFHNNRVFVFIGGFWWGLDPGYYPWDYPGYGYGYPYDYYNGYPSDYYTGNSYDYNYDPYNYDDQSAYGDSNQSPANATVSAVQLELAKLGYYNGAIDGTLGDQTEAAIARYQEDNDLSVTGTVNGATLQSLGVR
jgi:putative peptidoglycan binding protein